MEEYDENECCVIKSEASRVRTVYEVPEKAQRAVAYADKQELEESIIRRHYGTVAEEEPPQDVPAAVGGMNHGMQAEENSRKTILRP